FGSDNTPVKSAEPEPPTRPVAVDAPPIERAAWQAVASDTRLVTVQQGEFRLRFNTQSWAARITSPQVLAGQQISSPGTRTGEYCLWQPGAPKLLEQADRGEIIFSLAFTK